MRRNQCAGEQRSERDENLIGRDALGFFDGCPEATAARYSMHRCRLRALARRACPLVDRLKRRRGCCVGLAGQLTTTQAARQKGTVLGDAPMEHGRVKYA
eukprot:scaffold1627_cov126-Isochrysis_galbana.AAC.6